MTVSFSGVRGVTTFQAITLKSALAMFAKHGMRINRMWTPRKMMALAAHITGKTFKARDYNGAIAALDSWIKEFGGVSD